MSVTLPWLQGTVVDVDASSWCPLFSINARCICDSDVQAVFLNGSGLKWSWEDYTWLFLELLICLLLLTDMLQIWVKLLSAVFSQLFLENK